MAQPSVAREPSMEEILASIRRIIESNEQNAGGRFAPQPPAYAGEDDAAPEAAFAPQPSPVPAMPARNDPAPVFSVNVPLPPGPFQVTRSSSDVLSMPPAARQAAEAFAAQPEKAVSLADIAARVRAATERNAAAGPQAFASSAEFVAETELEFEPDYLPAAPAPVAPLFSPPLHERIAATPQGEGEDAKLAIAAADPVRGPAPAAEFRARPVWENVPASAAPQEGEDGEAALRHLISEEASAQVIRSFNELAAIFDGVQRRSIEEMAEEMMLPLLRGWLEGNLPGLVERLVREEIERVTGGPRR